MKLRSASLLVALFAASYACKKADAPAPGVAPVAQPAVGSAAAADDPWSRPVAKKEPLERPLLWSVEKDGRTSYLFGTMHLGIDPHARLPDVVWQKLDAAKTFAMESDIANAGGLNVMRSDGTTLRGELGEDHWKKLEHALGAKKAAQLDGFKAMVPATLVSMRGLDDTPPMDGVLHGRALNQNKPVVFLETIESAAAVLEKWMDTRALRQMLDDLELGEQRAKDMVAAYLSGDEARILALGDEGRDDFKRHGRADAEYDEMMEDLLYRRNAAWIPAIEKLHAEGGGFIAVGALHLAGPRSVNELLEKTGYKVTRITK
jgi:uncharacterized protein